jgi:cytochrome c oxidase subunit 4
MVDTHDPHGGHPTFRLYVVIALALAVFTIVSFIANQLVLQGNITAFAAFVVILGVAIVKATLVGMYYMHLKYEWGKLYFMIIPAFILAAMFVFVLLPDIVVSWHKADSGTVTTYPAGELPGSTR